MSHGLSAEYRSTSGPVAVCSAVTPPRSTENRTSTVPVTPSMRASGGTTGRLPRARSGTPGRARPRGPRRCRSPGRRRGWRRDHLHRRRRRAAAARRPRLRRSRRRRAAWLRSARGLGDGRRGRGSRGTGVAGAGVGVGAAWEPVKAARASGGAGARRRRGRCRRLRGGACGAGAAGVGVGAGAASLPRRRRPAGPTAAGRSAQLHRVRLVALALHELGFHAEARARSPRAAARSARSGAQPRAHPTKGDSPASSRAAPTPPVRLQRHLGARVPAARRVLREGGVTPWRSSGTPDWRVRRGSASEKVIGHREPHAPPACRRSSSARTPTGAPAGDRCLVEPRDAAQHAGRGDLAAPSITMSRITMPRMPCASASAG